MKYLKPNFWNKNHSYISYILVPFSYIWLIVTFLINIFKKEKKFGVPVICVGNIYLGGTGKTPLVLKISEFVEKIGGRPAIIKKYYKEHSDEFEMIKHSNGQLYTDKSRNSAICNAKNDGKKTMILDDGFQDKSVYKNLNILCFKSDDMAGNYRVIPAGPLREQFSNIKNSQIIVINGEKNLPFEKKIKHHSDTIKIYYSKYLPKNIEDFREKKLCAFAGIGNPDNFFKILKDNNLNVLKQISFPDHYIYKPKDISKLIKISEQYKLELITTEKDFHKVKNINKNIKFLSIDLVLDDQKEFFDNVKTYLND